MTEEDFKNRYYEKFDKTFVSLCENKIYEDNNFLNLVKLFDFGLAYSYFHHYYVPSDFPSLVELYYKLKHDIDDDGYVMFLKYELEHNYNLPEKFIIHNTTEFIIVGDYEPILTENHKNIIFKTNIGIDDCKWISYDFFRFDWDSLEFLANLPDNKLIQDFCKTSEFQHNTKEFITKYWEMENARDKKILDMISSKNPLTWR